MTVKPPKSGFRKSNGRFETVAAEGAAPAGAAAPAKPARRGPRLGLPILVLIAAAVFLDHTGTLSFWPAGAVSSKLMPLFPEQVQVAIRSVDTALTPGAATDAPGPGGPRGAASQGARRGRPGGDQAIPVLAAAVVREDVPVTASAVGTVQALATVTVRAQVDGQLLEVAFKDGQMVKKGDILARIDARTYQAQYDQAVAKKAQDEAQLANAQTDLVRYQKLATTDYGTKQQADTQKSTVAQLQALVRADQGAIDNARATLDLTTVTAPIDGRTGIRAVDQGNIVHASDTSGIVVITQIQPIAVVFNLPQQALRSVFAAMGRGRVAVDALESDDRTVLDHGTVEVIDNQVDQTTGTIRLKATFPNAQNQLWPGQFVNVRVMVDTLKDAVVVPSGAVQRGPAGAYVFVITDDGTVKQTPVVTGRQDELKAVVTSGLTPPGRVVTTGFTRLVDGAKVTVGSADAAPDAAAPPPAKRQGDRKKGTGSDPASPRPGRAAPETPAPGASAAPGAPPAPSASAATPSPAAGPGSAPASGAPP